MNIVKSFAHVRAALRVRAFCRSDHVNHQIFMDDFFLMKIKLMMMIIINEHKE